MTDDTDALVGRLRTDADEIEACECGNEASNMRAAADLITRQAAESTRQDHRIRRLEAALRVCRGWVINATEAQQARRDLVTLDAALSRQVG